jgi:carboxyl-terminal processing protease
MIDLRTLSAAFLCAIVIFFAGLWLGGHPGGLPDGLRATFVEDDRALRAELIEAIEDNFYREVDRDDLERASIRGMIRSLEDRFTHYFTPEETKVFHQSVSGRFDGVGMTVRQHKRGLLVVGVFDGSPAARAGIDREDVITRVNGKSLAGVATDIATARIKGKPGTSVRLTVHTPSTRRTRTLSVKRERISVPVAQGRIQRHRGTKLGIVRLSTFTSGAHGELRGELDELLDKGARGILLDVRGNGGGLLREAVLVASVFVEDGLIVSTDGRRKPRRKYEAEGDAIDSDVPVVVLVDRGSASASEIVAGALRDRGRAALVGTRTFGKGFFQEVEPLTNGGSLDITVGRYYLPNGEGISSRGIRPSVAARDRPRTRRDEALPVALRALLERLD